MVSTQEERLPIRVSVSIRRLSFSPDHNSLVLLFIPQAFTFTYDGSQDAQYRTEYDHIPTLSPQDNFVCSLNSIVPVAVHLHLIYLRLFFVCS